MDGNLACAISPHDQTFVCTAAAIPKPRVMVAEDDVNLGLALELTLSVAYDVSVVDSTRELLHLLDREPADLILVDYQLPDINGVRAIEVIHRRYGKTPPAIAMSGYPHRRTPCLAAGFGAFLQKPFRNLDLIHAVERALRS